MEVGEAAAERHLRLSESETVRPGDELLIVFGTKGDSVRCVVAISACSIVVMFFLLHALAWNMAVAVAS